MKITIITSVFNNAATIEEAIESVLSQTHQDIEYIIIDGASTDGTFDIVNKYKNRISKIISEPDNGIYDALNKGIELATGDVIGFLHSDDLYQNKDVLALVDKTFIENNVDSVFGDLTYVGKSDTAKVIRYWKSGNYSFSKLKYGWMPPHPTFFVKRDVYLNAGGFDTSYKIAADYDLILRLLGKYKIPTYYIPQVLIKMRIGGESNKSIRNLIRKSLDDYKAIKKNGIGNVGSLVFKNLSKLPQFFA